MGTNYTHISEVGTKMFTMFKLGTTMTFGQSGTEKINKPKQKSTIQFSFKIFLQYNLLTCTLLVVGSRVANRRSSARTLAPVNLFKSVLFPAFVYPTYNTTDYFIVIKFSQPILTNSLFPPTLSIFLQKQRERQKREK